MPAVPHPVAANRDTGTGVLGRAFTGAEAGTPLLLTIIPGHDPAKGQQTISLPVTKSRFASWDVLSDSAHFDEIEFTAWNSAPGLRTLLSVLNVKYPGQVRMSSHSMGAVVCAEALRQTTTNVPVVAVYAAFQGAVPSHCYDSNAPTRAIPFPLDHGTPNAFAHYWTSNSPPYLDRIAGAAKFVNFYNTNDYVLAQWVPNENLKPDASLGYVYNSGVFYNNYPTNAVVLSFPTDTYKLFSFCVQAR